MRKTILALFVLCTTPIYTMRTSPLGKYVLKKETKEKIKAHGYLLKKRALHANATDRTYEIALNELIANPTHPSRMYWHTYLANKQTFYSNDHGQDAHDKKAFDFFIKTGQKPKQSNCVSCSICQQLYTQQPN